MGNISVLATTHTFLLSIWCLWPATFKIAKMFIHFCLLNNTVQPAQDYSKHVLSNTIPWLEKNNICLSVLTPEFLHFDPKFSILTLAVYRAGLSISIYKKSLDPYLENPKENPVCVIFTFPFKQVCLGMQ